MMKNVLKMVLGLVLSSILLGCDNNSSADTTEPKIIQSTNHSLVQIETNYGSILIELFDDLTPETVDNFIRYVKEDFYDNTIIHQVLPGFIIQAGSYDSNFKMKPAYNKPISNESAKAPHHTRGTIAMMRNQHPDSATTEFFINLKDNDLFDINNGYAVFGKVIRGMEILDKISNIHTCANGPFYDDAPCEPVVIQKVTQMS